MTQAKSQSAEASQPAHPTGGIDHLAELNFARIDALDRERSAALFAVRSLEQVAHSGFLTLRLFDNWQLAGRGVRNPRTPRYPLLASQAAHKWCYNDPKLGMLMGPRSVTSFHDQEFPG